MKRKNIRIIIFLAIIALIGVITNQFYWINKEVKIQDNLLHIQKKNLEIKKGQFTNQVTLALVNVRDELLSLNKEASGLYLEPVKQINPNYFVVSFYDTLNPHLLKNLLVENFEAYHIHEVFEYGIYDCFTDSIIFDRYVDLSNNNNTSEKSNIQLEKWNHDGHYFGVYFPELEEVGVDSKEDVSKSFYISTIVMALIVLIFAYAILIILRQKKLSEVKTDFINNMTHELKTPIATISLSSDVLLNNEMAQDPDRVRRYAQIIKSENSRLESQVERVLQLAKLDKGDIQLNKELIDIKNIIENSIKIFQLSVEQKGGTIHLDFRASTYQIIADKVHFTNVIYNLLDNANKYSPNIPKIDISVIDKNNGVLIEVSDKGKGMTKEQLKMIFEKFYRVPTGSVHDVKGFGLGLYYVKRIIEKHRGKVQVDSELNQGSSFFIWLPSN